MSIFKRFIKDQRGSGTIAIKSLVLITFFIMMMYVIIDFYYLSNIYRYVKGQQDLANRAVYAQIDMTRLADRELYIDDTLGRAKFEEYLEKNLELDASNNPGRDIRIVGAVEVKEFIIYNTEDLPATTPNGKTVTFVSVYSEIEVEVRPFLYGKFGTIKLNPHLLTDLPDKLVKTFHP